MPLIDTYPFDKRGFSQIRNAQYGKDWPVVYVIENGKEAYIGESVSAYARLQQHFDNPLRSSLKTAHVISDPEFNKSATLDIESSLIQYLLADGRFKLQNGNAGLLNHSYFDREKYQAKFEILWQILQRTNLAKNDLVQLRNTDLFKYSPFKALTEEQFLLVNELFQEIVEASHGSYVIHGEAGTGKTILGVYLMKYLQEMEQTQNMKVALVVPMTSLRQTLKKVFRQVSGLNSKMVIGPNEVTEQDYDLLIVDESHRLHQRVNIVNYGAFDKTNVKLGLGKSGTELDWIMRSSRRQIFLYDSSQSVRPSDIKADSVASLNAKEYRLTSQLRVQGGEDYIEHIVNLLAGKKVNKYSSESYEFRIADNLQKMKTTIAAKNTKHGLSRLVAGYAWPWTSRKNTGQDYDIEIDGIKLKWNSVTVDWVNSPNAHAEVGCIHTVQGYDLNYVGVIIGPELSYDEQQGKICVNSAEYQDINGKKGIEDPAELERYIMNIYKTLMTRGIKGTYVYAVDPALHEYLKEFGDILI